VVLNVCVFMVLVFSENFIVIFNISFYSIRYAYCAYDVNNKQIDK